MKHRELDLDKLPKSIPKWIKPYLSPVTIRGEIPRVSIGDNAAPLRYITLKPNIITLEFSPLTHTLANCITNVMLWDKDILVPSHYVDIGDTATIILGGDIKLHKLRKRKGKRLSDLKSESQN